MLNCDKNFWENKPRNVITTLKKYKKFPIIFFQIDFEEKIDDVITVRINSDDLKYSKRTDTKNRKEFVCLEGGEFINFYDFNEDDVAVLMDYDILQQRDFTDEEIDFLNGIKESEFYLTRNEFTDNLTSKDEADKLICNPEFIENMEEFKVYNTGVQIARVSTWRRLFEAWKNEYKTWEDNCKHHATGQLAINHILHKQQTLKELTPVFHGAWFLHNLNHSTINGEFYVDNQKVLFNHHSWHSDFI